MYGPFLDMISVWIRQKDTKNAVSMRVNNDPMQLRVSDPLKLRGSG